MTIISLVKNMTIKLQSILEWFTSTHKFFIFSRNFLVRLAKRTLGSSKRNMCWQVLTMLMSEVFSNFMNSLFTTKSSDACKFLYCTSCSVLLLDEIGRRLRDEDSATGREICWSDDVRNDDVLSTSTSSHTHAVSTLDALPQRREGALNNYI